MTDQFWLWLGFVGMSLGAAIILARGGRGTAREETATILHGVVPIIAACSYLAMAVGQGSVPVQPATAGGTGYDFYFARYLDWVLTTPLLLVSLSLTAMHAGLRRPGLLIGAVLADAVMIVTALFFGLSAVPWIKWTWFAVSCGAFAAVYYVIWVGLREEAAAQRDDVATAFRRSAVLLSVIWLIYPVVLLLDPEGLGLIGPTTSVAAFAIIDLVAKVGYGLLATSEHTRIARRDLREGGPSPSVAAR